MLSHVIACQAISQAAKHNCAGSGSSPFPIDKQEALGEDDKAMICPSQPNISLLVYPTRINGRKYNHEKRFPAMLELWELSRWCGNPNPEACYPETCQGSGSISKAYCEQGTTTFIYGAEYIKQEIYQRGPVIGQMYVYSDFYYYRSGIYEHIGGDLVGAHAIVLLGWGDYFNTKYWIGQNSWDVTWGERGFFRASMETAKSGIHHFGGFCIPAS